MAQNITVAPKQVSDANTQGLSLCPATDTAGNPYKLGAFGVGPAARVAPAGIATVAAGSNTPAAATTISVGASPFAYTNASGTTAAVTLTGGTVSAVTLQRGGVTSASLATAGEFVMAPGDILNVTYTAAPAMTLYPGVAGAGAGSNTVGGSGTSAYTLGDVVAALKAFGLLIA